MNKKEYLEKRQGLINEAENLINNGKIEEANAKMEEVKKLDNQWEEIAKAQANLNALNDSNKGLDITNLAGDKGVDGVVVDTLDKSAIATDIDVYNSIEYRKAFMNNVLRGTPIPDKFVNADVNTKTTD